MTQLAAFFSVNTIAFEIIGYSMSYIEFIGTLCYLGSVWLIAERNMLTWPIGIVSVILFFFLFYQIRLYSDAIEQFYYLGASAYGWWFWKKDSRDEDRDKEKTVTVRLNPPKIILSWIAVTLSLSLLSGILMQQVHLYFPLLFPEQASYPFIDAMTTIMSFTAMFLMAQKRMESWVYWIIVDIIGIWLYYVKEVRFISLLYVILLCMAVRGFREWTKGGIRSEIS